MTRCFPSKISILQRITAWLLAYVFSLLCLIEVDFMENLLYNKCSNTQGFQFLCIGQKQIRKLQIWHFCSMPLVKHSLLRIKWFGRTILTCLPHRLEYLNSILKLVNWFSLNNILFGLVQIFMPLPLDVSHVNTVCNLYISSLLLCAYRKVL